MNNTKNTPTRPSLSQPPDKIPGQDRPLKNRSGMFIAGFVDDYGLTDSELRVLSRISRRNGKDKGCHESVRSMCRGLKKSTATVVNDLTNLVRYGCIKQVGDFVAGVSGNIYEPQPVS